MDDGRGQWTSAVVLGDGESALMRPLAPTDAAALRAFHERQPSESQYRRFFSPKPTLSDSELVHFTDIDFRDRVALVVELRGQFIAWASYERWQGRDDADVAFMVDSQHQGKGIATLLLEHLAAIARSNGISRFTAETLADNRSMIAVFTRAGWPVRRHFDSGVVDIDFPLDDTAGFLDSVEAREHRADSRAVARLLLPRSIAVIGASDRPDSIGRELWINALRSGVPVVAVNPARTVLDGRTCHARLTEVPDDIWLALIAVPPSQLRRVIDECIAKRVRGAVIATVVDTGLPELVDHARRNGLRLIGPASMGIASSRSAEGRALSAGLVPTDLPPGGVAVSMQSGSLGAALLRQASRLQMGLSWFVSLGDKCDISGNDLLQFWEDDDRTRVIAVYTESFGNPRKFARIARRVSRRRPIVAVRTGTAADEPVARSGGSVSRGPSAAALYLHAGVIEVPTAHDLLQTARVLDLQPIPRGPRIAVVANSRSPRVLTEGAIRAAGLEVADWPPGRPGAHLDWRSGPDDVAAAVREALASVDVDGVVVVHAPPLASAAAPVDEIDTAALGCTKPVLAVLLGAEDGLLRPGSRVPTFSFPESAVAVLARMQRYGHWLATEADAPITTPDAIDPDRVETLIDLLAHRDADCSTEDAIELLAAYGITLPPTIVVDPPETDEVISAAGRIGYPVAVKASVRLVGSTASAGVALDLGSPDEVRHAVQVMHASLGATSGPITVQAMIAPGAHIRIRAVADPRLGPVVTVGLGGAQSDLLDATSFRLAPMSRIGAEELLGASLAARAIDATGADRSTAIDLILRVAHLMAEHPRVHSIDLNPVVVTATDCITLDTDVVVARHEPDTVPLRRL